MCEFILLHEMCWIERVVWVAFCCMQCFGTLSDCCEAGLILVNILVTLLNTSHHTFWVPLKCFWSMSSVYCCEAGLSKKLKFWSPYWPPSPAGAQTRPHSSRRKREQGPCRQQWLCKDEYWICSKHYITQKLHLRFADGSLDNTTPVDEKTPTAANRWKFNIRIRETYHGDEN